MRILNSNNTKYKRKAISSIVGGIFFLVLMTAGFTVYYVALDNQSQMLDTQQIIADTEVAKIQENFVVAASSDPGDNNRLKLQVVNVGNNPVKVADIWIINKTDTNEPATRHNLDYRDTSIPVGYTGDILNNTALYLNPEEYSIKVISELGTIRTVYYDVNGGSNVLTAQMLAVPAHVRIGENATVALIVTNIGDFAINQVQPDPISVNPPSAVVASTPLMTTPVDLEPSQSAFFTWQYTLTGSVDSAVTFSGTATGTLASPVTSNLASATVTLSEDETQSGSSGGEGEEIVVKDELFGKPDIFMIFPNPLGDDPDSRTLWGVLVANPTDQQIEVSKVAIIAISPRPNSDDKIFAPVCHFSGSPFSPITVAPTTSAWTCPAGNQLQWKDSTPQVIEPRSVFPFLVRIGPDTIGTASNEVNNIVIQTTVFTTLGQFGKAGYMSTMNKEPVALPNVYLTTDYPSTTNPATMIGEIRGITEGTTVIFNATIADMDSDTTYEIKQDSRLIINIPKDWTYNGYTPNPTGFNSPLTELNFPDGSTQLIGILSSDLDGGGGTARTIQFNATAPSVTNAKMYIMHILGDGLVTGKDQPVNGFTMGPIAESVLQVCPNSGCP